MTPRMIQVIVCCMLAASVGLFAAGCQSGDSTNGSGASMGVINDTCPCGMEAKDDVHVEHKGEKVGFCCENCASAWKQKSDDEKSDYVTDQVRVNMGIINSACPVMSDHPVNPTVETVSYKGNKIGFCCAGCEMGWEKMTDQQKAEFVSKNAGN